MVCRCAGTRRCWAFLGGADVKYGRFAFWADGGIGESLKYTSPHGISASPTERGMGGVCLGRGVRLRRLQAIRLRFGRWCESSLARMSRSGSGRQMWLGGLRTVMGDFSSAMPMSCRAAGDAASRGVADAVASGDGGTSGGAYPDAAIEGGADDVAAG